MARLFRVEPLERTSGPCSSSGTSPRTDRNSCTDFCITALTAAARRSTAGSSMVVVDAIGERAAAFYEAHGFVRLPGSMRLVLPMWTVVKLYGD